jgi:hypothetical protein
VDGSATSGGRDALSEDGCLRHRGHLSVGVMMCEPFLTLSSAISSFSKVGVSTLTAVIFAVVASTHTSKVFLARLCNVDRPDQHSVFFFKLSALDRATLNSSQRNSFSLMLCYACLVKQFRSTLLCPQIGGRQFTARANDDRSLDRLHTNFDRPIIRSIILRVLWDLASQITGASKVDRWLHRSVRWCGCHEQIAF